MIATNSRARREATSPVSTPQPLRALDHPQDELLGQLGGVGRVAGFMARVTERDDEHDGGSLVAGSLKTYARPSSAAKRF